MKTCIFIQARTGSSRLKDKVLEKIAGKTIIEIVADRAKKVKGIGEIVLATSKEQRDDRLEREAERLGIECFRGSEENVLDRFYQASLKFQPDIIIRITADCPLIDPSLVSQGLEEFLKGDYDILANTRIRTFPDGMDFEVFRAKALEETWQKSDKDPNTFVNPVKGILEGEYRKKDFVYKENKADIRLTLDYSEDLAVIKKVYEELGQDCDLEQILSFLNDNKEILSLNKEHIQLSYGIKI